MYVTRLRTFGLLCSTVFTMGVCGSAVAAVDAPVSQARDISGMWWIDDYQPTLAPNDGSSVPYTAVGKAAHEQNLAQIASHKLFDKALTRCLPQGLPRAMLSGYPLKIVEHRHTFTFMHEQNHSFWHSIVDAEHRKVDDIDPAFMGGDSVARWDGDSLIVDSVQFKDGFLDEDAMPHSDALHVTMRLRKLKDGRQLEALMTIDDPKMFTKPWTAKRTYEWRPDVMWMEYVCGEANRALTGDRTKAVKLNWVAP